MHLALLAVASLASLTVAFPRYNTNLSESLQAAYEPEIITLTPYTPESALSNSTLAPRGVATGSRPWIGMHYLPGCGTKGPLPEISEPDDPERGYVSYDRPFVPKGQCVGFSSYRPGANYLGIFWGTKTRAIGKLQTYRDKNCGTAGPAIVRKGGEAGGCADFQTLVNSVKAF